jgi:adenosylcobinamide kinase/adenosylcobinamide-phosphate guanylyltransferase
VATATAGDAEMTQRIAAHRSNRPTNWFTLEAPVRVSEAIQDCSFKPDFVLLDCLTLLANNRLMELPEPVSETAYQAVIEEELEGLLQSWRSGSADWVIVSNEVGLGIVPAYPMGRVYRDVLGKANQRLAQQANRVLLMVAGLPMLVKDSG